MPDRQRCGALVAEVDSDIASIVPEFLENRRKDCRLVAQLVEREAFGDIRILGHRMRGAGGSYGFDDISEVGGALEDAALAGDAASIRAAVQHLEEYLDRVVVVYV